MTLKNTRNSCWWNIWAIMVFISALDVLFPDDCIASGRAPSKEQIRQLENEQRILDLEQENAKKESELEDAEESKHQWQQYAVIAVCAGFLVLGIVIGAGMGTSTRKEIEALRPRDLGDHQDEK